MARAVFKVERKTQDVQGGTVVKKITSVMAKVAPVTPATDEIITITSAGVADSYVVETLNPFDVTMLEEGKSYYMTFVEVTP